MLDYIVHFVEQVGQWGYFIIFFVVMIECQALLGLFMPGESLALVSGFLAAQEVFDLDVALSTFRSTPAPEPNETQKKE
jgi:membrane protein DedA with SNARE-associated domain